VPAAPAWLVPTSTASLPIMQAKLLLFTTPYMLFHLTMLLLTSPYMLFHLNRDPGSHSSNAAHHGGQGSLPCLR
jgi:hypothetical protein